MQQDNQPIIQTILGSVPSKSNSYKIITVKKKGGGQHAGLGKPDELKRYEESFYEQCRHYRNKMMTVPFEINLKVYFQNALSDLDNSLKIILDCLQESKAIKNDKQCVAINALKLIDKNNPRVEFFIKAVK